MNAFDDRLRNAQSDVPSFVSWASFTQNEDTRLVLEKIADFIRTQVPHLGDFRNGVVPLDVHRCLNW
jgi:hypothetical protein